MPTRRLSINTFSSMFHHRTWSLILQWMILLKKPNLQAAGKQSRLVPPPGHGISLFFL